jgi:chemotaxis protein MotC
MTNMAREDFDTARLLAPGTLSRKQHLRRLMSIHRRSEGSRNPFLRVSSRYARRFVASPYALQYAQEFTAGVIAMGDMDGHGGSR